MLVARCERCDSAQCSIAARDIRVSEVRADQETQRLAPELELVFFLDVEIAQDRDVHLSGAGP